MNSLNSTAFLLEKSSISMTSVLKKNPKAKPEAKKKKKNTQKNTKNLIIFGYVDVNFGVLVLVSGADAQSRTRPERK